MQSACQLLLNGSFNNEVFDLLQFLRGAGFKSTGIMENKPRIRGKNDLVSNVVDPTLDDPSNWMECGAMFADSPFLWDLHQCCWDQSDSMISDVQRLGSDAQSYLASVLVTNHWIPICSAHFLQDSRLSSIGSTQNEYPESRKLLPNINTVRRTWQGLGMGIGGHDDDR
jgi:hypothetical protein